MNYYFKNFIAPHFVLAEGIVVHIFVKSLGTCYIEHPVMKIELISHY